MVIRLFDDPAPRVESTKLVTCPECGGRGEVELASTADRDLNGVWTVETPECLRCKGTGEVEFLRCLSVECGVWFDPAEQLCGHDEPVCDAHRVDCRECMLDARDAS
jgi:hypothetical protein